MCIRDRSVGADGLYVAYRHAVRATGGALRGHNAFYLYAVSYTHLDVYKRQRFGLSVFSLSDDR